MKLFIKTLSMLALASLFVAGCKEQVQEEPVSIKLNKGLITNLPVGSTQTLVATVLPEGADVTVAWTSDNEDIAVVNNDGEVTGIAPGTAVITAQAKDALATCKVTVTAAKPTKIALSSSNLELPVDTQHLLEVVYIPTNAVAADLVWSSSNKKVATVENSGLVTALAEGNTTITVKCNGGMLASVCQVKVIGRNETVVIESISVQPASLNLEVGSESNLTLVVNPDNAVVENVTWTSNNASVVSVDDKGHVKALSAGDATVTVKCNNGAFSADCQVKVNAKDNPGSPDTVKVSEIQMPSTLNLKPGEEKTLDVTVLPADAENKSLKFTSDNDCVIVEEYTGKIKAVKSGTAKVTAEALDGSGVKAVCTVTVKSDSNITSVVLHTDANQSDLQVGLPLQIKTAYNPIDASPNSVSWTVDRSDLAEIDQNGQVTGKLANKNADGEWEQVTVTITADGISASMSLRVIPRQPDAIEVDMPSEGYIRVGQAWNFNPRVLPEGLGFTVYCSASLPNGRPHNEPYSAFVSDVPGEIKGIFAVSNNENLVYTSLRKEVYLQVKPYYVQTITLPQTKEVEVGGSFILTPEFTADVEGYQPTYKDVNWTSSDETKATVDENGKVTALAAGTVQITATTSNSFSVPHGQEQKSATCTLVINEATVSINVGDYYYSDGTWSSELDPSKTVIGVVFARANSASSDSLLAKDYPGCVHGLVLSIEEYVESCTTDRTWLRADLITWMDKNGYNQWSVDDKYCGYNNTQGLIALNAANVKSGDGVIHVDHIDAVLQHRQKVQSPAEASAWYMPSYLEMKELSANLDVVNASLEKIGGTTLRRTYEYVYDRHTGGDPIPTVGTAEQHYYYSNNITESTIYAYNMNTDKLVNPKVSTSPWDSVSGERTPLPVRVVLAF